MNIFEKLFAEVEVPELIPVRFNLPIGTIKEDEIGEHIKKAWCAGIF